MKIVVLNKIKNLTFFNTKKSELILYVIIGVCAALKGPFLHRDSYAFLEMPLNRSPLYVLFLKLFTTLFGDNYITHYCKYVRYFDQKEYTESFCFFMITMWDIFMYLLRDE